MIVRPPSGPGHSERRASGSSPLAAISSTLLLLSLLLLLPGCQSMLPPPEKEIAPPPMSYFSRTTLAPGARLLEFKGAETQLSGGATYLSGSGGNVSMGLTFSMGRRRHLPRIQATALILDLAMVELLPVARPAPVGSEGETLSQRPLLFLEENPEFIAAINATPFDPNVVSVGKAVDPIGLVRVDGRELSEPVGRYAALYLPRVGPPRIGMQGAERAREGEQSGGAVSALGGYFVVLEGGAPQGPQEMRSARSAVGLSEDGRTIILFAVAGDSPGKSVGLTAREVGRWLKELGAYRGLLLDGGGSSSLAVRLSAETNLGSGGAGIPRTTITPSWGPTLGVERPVATLLAVRPK